jgi:hypothetical protein
MTHYIEIKDIAGNTVQAEVGDTIAAYCAVTKKVRADTIQRTKGGLYLSNLKYTPKPSQCLFIGKGNLIQKSSNEGA